MIATQYPQWLGELRGRLTPSGEFIASLEELEARKQPHPQAHVIKQGWKALGLDAVLCVGTKPLFYFKRSDVPFAPEEVRSLHRKFWNHSSPMFLVLADNQSIRVFLSTDPPVQDNAYSPLPRIFETLKNVADLLEFIQQAETGYIYQDRGDRFTDKDRVDRKLLANLDEARQHLLKAGNLRHEQAHALLARVVFTCFLTDRRILDEKRFQSLAGVTHSSSLKDILTSDLSANLKRQAFYNLFRGLQGPFNGELFSADLAAEEQIISDAHIQVLSQFLQGHDLKIGQQVLSFWAYDFSVIPVELLSQVYEQFLTLPERRKEGVFYTPKHLAEIVVDFMFQHEGFEWERMVEKKFLDPSCGSGIFLVTLFHRLSGVWKRLHPQATSEERVTGLRRFLEINLFGVEKQDAACQVAALSLYLAYLDQLEDTDLQLIWERSKLFPDLVWRQGSAGQKQGNNILCSDFFNDAIPLAEHEFDYVVGNPPWAKVGDQDPAATWATAFDMPLPKKQVAYAFTWKAGVHLASGGRATLLLPAGFLLHHSSGAIQAQQHFFNNYGLEAVINFSDVRHFLFETSVHPAIALRYRNANNRKPDRVLYVCPQTDLESRIEPGITIAGIDCHVLRRQEILEDLENGIRPLAWKARMRGTYRDERLLRYLVSCGRLSDYNSETSQNSSLATLVIHPGYKGTRDKKAKFSLKREELPTDVKFEIGPSIAPFLLFEEKHTQPISDEELASFGRARMAKDGAQYRPPLVLVNQGIRAWFTGFPILYKNVITGISGGERDADALLLLAFLLNSKVASYFFFHYTTSWGVERVRVDVEELLSFPFVRPENNRATPRQRDIAKQIVAKACEFQTMEDGPLGGERGRRIQEFMESEEAEQLAYDYYDLRPSDILLIRDTVDFRIKSAGPSRPQKIIRSLLISTPEQRQAYARQVVSIFNRRYAGVGSHVEAQIVINERSGHGLFILHLKDGTEGKRNIPEKSAPAEFKELFQRLSASLRTDASRSLRYLRNLKVIDGREIFLLKPLARRNWCESQALVDADELAVDILRNPPGGRNVREC